MKLKEEKSKIRVENIYPEPNDGKTIKNFIKSIVKKGDWYDVFADEDLDDDGADINDYYMIGDKLYDVELHCEAEWCGDWSVRANLPGEVTVVTIREITHFEILEKNKKSIMIKLK